MLSYRHAFHAGNSADVLKHLVLVETLQYAARKPAPLLYIDTHAGAGLYPLNGTMARSTGEAQAGVLALTDADGAQSAALAAYREVVDPFIRIQQYPGSPLLAATLLRPQDRLHLFELHSTDFPELLATFRSDPRVRSVHGDGYSNVLALLPPKAGRALLLVDPAYELDSDYDQAVACVVSAWQRMPQCQILLWYPVVSRPKVERIARRLRAARIRDLWCFELGLTDDRPGPGMTGSGLFAINPPWNLPPRLREALPVLRNRLASKAGFFRVECLAAE
jgi:23S rRNA (adenine2030-N6)-methyltransferase